MKFTPIGKAKVAYKQGLEAGREGLPESTNRYTYRRDMIGLSSWWEKGYKEGTAETNVRP